MKTKNIEAEGGELVLMSREGHYAIIPKKDRTLIKDKIGDDTFINNYISKLPLEAEYAEDGSLLLNPDNPPPKTQVDMFNTVSNSYKFKNPVLGRDKSKVPQGVSKKLTPKEFTEAYIQSPVYKNRLKSSGYQDVDAEINNRLTPVSKTYSEIYTPKVTKVGNLTSVERDFSKLSNARQPDKVLVNTAEAKEIGTSVEDIETHEYSHKETGLDGGQRLNKADKSALTTKLKKNTSLSRHGKAPEENKADLNALRYDLYNKGVDVLNKNLTKKDLEHLKTDTKYTTKRLLKHYEEEDLLWLLNNVADNTKSNETGNIG